ncbi:PilZ domain-containing protein [Lentibacillus halodurans]|uniref:PilZ domain-containing protein n=1 Tax=Lentibacillus halodurans TaxID=237679 RepID=A0A1I1ABH1_9BACI|nr:PilZ domain-containing protein [Lentibacillus halodurans]SFB35307.1 PilZ domain-containing protein [Lentibacillus halodurans]
MYYKRNESYRFVFHQPVAGKLTRSETYSKVTTDVEVLDVSNQGAKLFCPNTVNLKKHTNIFLSFRLNTALFQAAGVIVWIKKYPRSCELGVHLNTDEEYKESMTRELKQIAKKATKNK